MITKNRNNPTQVLEDIHAAIQRNVASRLTEMKSTYSPLQEMEELPDQKKYLSMDELKALARKVDRKEAAGTNYAETNDENGSQLGKTKTLLQVDEKCNKTKYEEYEDDEDLNEAKMSKDDLTKAREVIKIDDNDEPVSQSIGMRVKANRTYLLNKYGKNWRSLVEAKLDPVGKEDDDVDNDGDVDSSDRYLKKRRDKISAAISENLEKYKKLSNAEIMKKYKAIKNGKNQKEIDDLVQEIEYRGLSESYVLMTHSAPKQYFKKSDNKGNVAWKPTGVLSQATRFDSEEEADNFRKNSKERKYDNSLYSAKIVKLDESLDEAVKVTKNTYSWGNLVTVQDGAYQSFPIHPADMKKIEAMQDGDTVRYKDETNRDVVVSLTNGKFTFGFVNKSISSRKTKVPAEKLLQESVSDLKKKAKGSKDFTIELDDGEEVDLDPNMASVLVSKASERDIKAAMKSYDSFMTLLNKVLR